MSEFKRNLKGLKKIKILPFDKLWCGVSHAYELTLSGHYYFTPLQITVPCYF